MSRFFLFLSVIGMLFIGCARERNYDFISISAGSRGGVYQDVADSIANWYGDETDAFSFKTIPSSGSLENMERLENGMADLIIVQRDVASRAYFKKDAPFRHMEIVMPLFPEGLHIIVNDTSGVISFDDFAKRVDAHKIHTIAADNETTVSYQTAQDVLSMMGVQTKDLTFDTRPLGEAVQDFNRGAIDCIVYYTTFPSTRLNAITDSLPRAIVSFSDDDLRYLGAHMSFIDNYTFKQPYTFINSKKNIKTIGTWAFLIGKSDVVDYMEEALQMDLCQIVLQNLIGDDTIMHVIDPEHITPVEIFKLTYLGEGRDLFKVEKPNDKYVVAESRDDIEFITRGIPMLSSTKDLLDPPKLNVSKKSLKGAIWIGVGIFILLYILIKRPKALNYRLWLKSARYIIGAIALCLLFIGIQYYIYVLEIQFSIEHSVTSPVTQLNTIDRVLWLLVMAFTGYEQQIFPYDNLSKTLIGILSVFSYLFIFVGVLFELARESATRKRRMGLIQIPWQDHILITGWNHSSPDFVVKLIEATKPSKGIFKWLFRGIKNVWNAVLILLNRINESLSIVENRQLKLLPINKQIVIVHPDISDVFQRNETLRLELEYGRRLLYVNGRANEHAVLEQANAHTASLVLHLLRDHNNGEVESLVKQNIKDKDDDAILSDEERMFYDNRTILDARNINAFTKFVFRDNVQTKRKEVDDYIRNVAAFYNYEKLSVIQQNKKGINDDNTANEAQNDQSKPKSAVDLHNIEINELIDREKLVVELMANALEYDGSLQFILEMLNYGGYCDLFSIDTTLDEHRKFHGQHYHDLFQIGKEFDLLLIGVRRALLYDYTKLTEDGPKDENGELVVDYILSHDQLELCKHSEDFEFDHLREEIDNDKIRDMFNLEFESKNNKEFIGNFVISPPEKAESEFKIKYGDKLYFLAPSEEQLKRFVKKYATQLEKYSKRNKGLSIRSRENEVTALASDSKNEVQIGGNPLEGEINKESFVLLIYGDPSGVNWSTLHLVVKEVAATCKEVYWLSKNFQSLHRFTNKLKGLEEVAHNGNKDYATLGVFDSDFNADLIDILATYHVKVIIMPEEDNIVADENVLLSLMRIYDRIETLSNGDIERGKQKQTIGNATGAPTMRQNASKMQIKDVRYLCVLNHYTYRKSFYDFAHTEILCLPEISDGVLIQSAINRDFSKLLSEVLGITDATTQGMKGTSRNEFAVIEVDEELIRSFHTNKGVTYQQLVDKYSYLQSGIIIGIIQNDKKIERLKKEKPFDFGPRCRRAVYYRKFEAFEITHKPTDRVIVSPRRYIKEMIQIEPGDKIIVLRNRSTPAQSPQNK